MAGEARGGVAVAAAHLRDALRGQYRRLRRRPSLRRRRRRGGHVHGGRAAREPGRRAGGPAQSICRVARTAHKPHSWHGQRCMATAGCCKPTAAESCTMYANGQQPLLMISRHAQRLFELDKLNTARDYAAVLADTACVRSWSLSTPGAFPAQRRRQHALLVGADGRRTPVLAPRRPPRRPRRHAARATCMASEECMVGLLDADRYSLSQVRLMTQ